MRLPAVHAPPRQAPLAPRPSRRHAHPLPARSPPIAQLCVWKLGAPTAAMFFGLRLVFSVALSNPILSSTIIQTGVQVWTLPTCAATVCAGAGSACCGSAS